MSSTAYTHINLDYLNLMSDNDDDMKKMMLEMLFEEPVQQIEEMQRNAADGDYKNLKAVSHKLKSTFPFVGNQELTSTNEEVERIAKSEENTAQLESLLKKVEQLYSNCLVELKQEHASL